MGKKSIQCAREKIRHTRKASRTFVDLPGRSIDLPYTSTQNDDTMRVEDPASAGSVLFYDAGCGVCAWIVLRVLRAVPVGSLLVASIDSPAGEQHLGHLSDAERWASWHLLSGDGRLSSGGAALPALLELLPRARRLAPLLRAMPRVVDSLYRALARTRPRWGRLVPNRAVGRARRELHIDLTNPQEQGRAQCTIH